MLLEGLHIPLTTPFHPDGRLNPRKLESNVARYSKTPAAGFVVLGPKAETTLLTDEETREVLRTAADAAAMDKVLLGGISRDGVRATLALADFAAEYNYDAVLVGLPSIVGVEHLRELLTYFQTVADHSPLPVVLLSSNARCVPIDVVVELAAHPGIIGLLDSAGQPGEIETILRRAAAVKREVSVTPIFTAVTARMLKAAAGRATATLISAATLTGAVAVAEPPQAPSLKTRAKTVGFQILAGATSTMLDSLRYGASGIAPGFAACAPQACYEVFAAWKDDDQPLAEEKQARLVAAAQLAEDALGTGGLKFSCDLNGYFGGLPRLPHLPPTGEQRARLEQLMDGMRN
jgi:4-hydroxy-2-oxoglutarate aldolase